MSKRHRSRPKPTGKLIPFLMSLNRILAERNLYRASGDKVVAKTVKAAKKEVSDALGHKRESITDAYIG